MVKIGEYYNQRRFFVSLDDVPPLLYQAFISAEDDSFFEHSGVSIMAIIRAMIKNIQAGYKKQGGSTITQQVARALLLTPEKKYSRKVKEIILAFLMERFFSKQEILEIYLNQVYLGNTAYGVQAAAEVYFGKDMAQMTLAEMAMIAGLTKAPSRDNPKKDLQKAKERQSYVLSRLLTENKISKQEHDQAVEEKIKVAQKSNLNLEVVPYFVEHIRTYLMDKYGAKRVLEQGLQVHTTLDIKAALSANTALKKGLEKVDRRQGYAGVIKNIPLEDKNKIIEGELLTQWASDSPHRQALVLDYNNAQGWVHLHLGQREGYMLLEDFVWARKPDPNVYWEYRKIKKPSEVFQKGDLIWVKPNTEDATSTTVPETFKALQRYALFQVPRVQGAILGIDPRTQEVKAMVGGYDFEVSQFNRALQSKRQPGSAFKPVIYASALDKGYTSATIINDAPVVYDDPTNEFRWKPKNYSGKFYGDTIFRDSLIQSRNIPTIKILQDVGVDHVIKYARKMGIESKMDRNFSLGLGSSSVSLMEMAKAFGVFASGGKKIAPYMISKVTDRDGTILESHQRSSFQESLDQQVERVQEHAYQEQKVDHIAKLGENPENKLPKPYAISPQTAFIMTHMLSEVITAGTGRKAISIGRPAAGKTGTTNDNLDAWFAGFTPDLVAVVWVGFDDQKPLAKRESGGSTAAPIWLDFMKGALEGKPKLDFERPPGISFAKVDAKTGYLATPQTKRVVTEVFRKGTVPEEATEQEQQTQDTQNFFMTE